MEPAVDYLFPAVCVHCRTERRRDAYLCADCHTEAFGGHKGAFHPEEGVVCIHRLNPVVRTLIHGLKYQGMRGVASYLVSQAPAEFWESPVMLQVGRWAWVPVPLHPGRLRERGYNQSEQAARSIQERKGGTLYPGILRRSKYAVSQTKLVAEKRRWNIAGAFAARPPVPYSVMVVDDVYTTGSTTAACRFALERAGCQVVRIVTLAYEPQGNGHDDWILDQTLWKL